MAYSDAVTRLHKCKGGEVLNQQGFGGINSNT